jgi:hypothetical protein
MGANRVPLHSNNLRQGSSVFDIIVWPSGDHSNLPEAPADDLTEVLLPLEFQRPSQSYRVLKLKKEVNQFPSVILVLPFLSVMN